MQHIYYLPLSNVSKTDGSAIRKSRNKPFMTSFTNLILRLTKAFPNNNFWLTALSHNQIDTQNKKPYASERWRIRRGGETLTHGITNRKV